MKNQSEDYPQRNRATSEAKELPLQSILQSWFDNHDISVEFDEGEIIDAWEEITGGIVKKLSKRVYVRDKVLYVCVNAPALKSELMMMRTALKDKLNERLGAKRIKSIIIK